MWNNQSYSGEAPPLVQPQPTRTNTEEVSFTDRRHLQHSSEPKTSEAPNNTDYFANYGMLTPPLQTEYPQASAEQHFYKVDHPSVPPQSATPDVELMRLQTGTPNPYASPHSPTFVQYAAPNAEYHAPGHDQMLFQGSPPLNFNPRSYEDANGLPPPNMMHQPKPHHWMGLNEHFENLGRGRESPLLQSFSPNRQNSPLLPVGHVPSSTGHPATDFHRQGAYIVHRNQSYDDYHLQSQQGPAQHFETIPEPVERSVTVSPSLAHLQHQISPSFFQKKEELREDVNKPLTAEQIANGEKRKWPCIFKDCKKVYTTGAGLRYHLHNYHNSPSPRFINRPAILFPCDKCNKSYVTKAGLRYHKTKAGHLDTPPPTSTAVQSSPAL